MKSTKALCDVCGKNEFKYRCPGCGKKTCCLECSKQHKKDDACDGLRKPMQFIPIKEFNDDIITDDYYYLHHLAQVVDNTQRNGNPSGNNSVKINQQHKRSEQQNLPKCLSSLIHQAKLRKTTIRLMPKGMTRQLKNKTKYMYRKGIIDWTIEYRFPHIIPVIEFCRQESELNTIRDSLDRALNNHEDNIPRQTLLNKYRSVGVDGLVVLLEKIQEEGHTGEYYMLPIDHTWREIFAGNTFIEYPTVLIIFASDLTKYKLAPFSLVELDPWTPPVVKKNKPKEDSILSNDCTETKQKQNIDCETIDIDMDIDIQENNKDEKPQIENSSIQNKQ
ncbi:hypothetical protein WA158_003632 [Blastocystis sp. Blastoise]